MWWTWSTPTAPTRPSRSWKPTSRAPAARCAGGEGAVASRDGARRNAEVLADLAALCRGEHPGRTGDGEVTLFKSVGTAVADLAAAVALWDALAPA